MSELDEADTNLPQPELTDFTDRADESPFELKDMQSPEAPTSGRDRVLTANSDDSLTTIAGPIEIRKTEIETPVLTNRQSEMETRVGPARLDRSQPEIRTESPESKDTQIEELPELNVPKISQQGSTALENELEPPESKPELAELTPKSPEMGREFEALIEDRQLPNRPQVETNHQFDELNPENWRPVENPVFNKVFNKGQATTKDRIPVGPATLVRSGDGQPMPEIYLARSEANSDHWLTINGGSAETQQAVEKALEFLVRAQEEDGRWDASRFGGGLERRVLGHDRQGAGIQADTAVTSLALLAFLASGNTHLDGEHALTVQRGLEFLASAQRDDGSLAGNSLLFSQMYCHSMASLALSEAYAMTGDNRLQKPVERAIEFTLRAQNPTDGGWRYRPGDSGDMSQFGWHVMALKSAQLAGIDIPKQTWNRMHAFLNSCCRGKHAGIAAYRPGEAASRVMTAEALVCRFFLEGDPDPNLIEEAANAVNGQKPGQGMINYYYWYYGTIAMKSTGGDAWKQWNEALKSQLLELQRKDGVLQGSFDADGVWSGYGGRIYSTAMATLCLESYYRFLPALQKQPDREIKPAESN